MNKELQVLADCFYANKLSLNISKTKCMLFYRSPLPENEEISLTMSNTIIQRLKCVQFLGLHIYEILDWHEHINKCKNKLASALYVINTVKSYLHVSALKTIYYTLVTLTWHMESSCGGLHIKRTWHNYLLSKKNCSFHTQKKLLGTFSPPLYMLKHLLNWIMYTNWRLGNVCIIMFTGVYAIIYPRSLHLPMAYIFTNLDKPHIYVLSLL